MTMRPTAFRLLLAGIAAAVTGPAIAQSCIQSAERTAFDVRALQSQLQVAALACRDQGYPQFESQYRSFVQKFQSEFQAPARSLQGYFRRTGGNNHARELDGYITNLANAQMQDGLRQGSQFCSLIGPLFTVALAQSNAQGLAEVSADRNLLNIMANPSCPATPTTTRTPATRQPARPAASNRSAAATR
jgi:hypothetical protein